MDVLGEFLAERCIQSKMYETTAKALYTTYLAWCDQSGEKPVSQRSLGLSLRERGLTKFKSRGHVVWRGIGLLAGDEREEGNHFSESSLTRENSKKLPKKGLDPLQGVTGQTEKGIPFSGSGEDRDDINSQDTLERRGI